MRMKIGLLFQAVSRQFSFCKLPVGDCKLASLGCNGFMKKQLSWILLFAPLIISAQGTKADYERANGFRERFRGLILNERLAPTWIGNTEKFWYIKQETGGNRQFLLVDPLNG